MDKVLFDESCSFVSAKIEATSSKWAFLRMIYIHVSNFMIDFRQTWNFYHMINIHLRQMGIALGKGHTQINISFLNNLREKIFIKDR